MKINSRVWGIKKENWKHVINLNILTIFEKYAE